MTPQNAALRTPSSFRRPVECSPLTQASTNQVRPPRPRLVRQRSSSQQEISDSLIQSSTKKDEFNSSDNISENTDELKDILKNMFNSSISFIFIPRKLARHS